MAEEHDRCRFWPHCAIHTGAERPHRFSEENRQEMTDLYLAGHTVTEIARLYGGQRSTVSSIVHTWKDKR